MSTYTIKLNNTTFKLEKATVCGKEILELAGYTPAEDYELLLKTNYKGFEPIQLTEEVDLTVPGIEYFSAKLYKTISIEIDDDEYELDHCFTTPKELLELAGRNIREYYLTQIKKGDVEIGYKEQNDANHKIQVKNGAEFFTSLRNNQCIIVNGTSHTWTYPEISYDDVVKLANGSTSNVNYTVSYVDGVEDKPQGAMVKGSVVKVKHKMIFNVSLTNKS